MKVTILVNDCTSIREMKGEHGFSAWIECDGKKILFDCGETALFIENADRLGIDLTEVDMVVLSHGHHDHSWGLKYLLNILRRRPRRDKLPQFIAHPAVFHPKRDEGLDVGMDVGYEQIARNFTMRLAIEPITLTDKLMFLGQIKRRHDFEPAEAMGEVYTDEGWQKDFLLDDSGLAYKSDSGLVVLSGCAHSGICNMLSQAQEVCEERRIVDIIGGLHLHLEETTKEKLDAVGAYLKSQDIKCLHAGHCTDLWALTRLADTGVVAEVSTGMSWQFA